MHNQLDEPPSYWQRTVPAMPLPDELPSQTDLVVIGAGWLGTATAYWAAQTGASVVLLDRQGFAAGATGRNGGFLGCGPDEPYQDAVARLGEQAARTILDITLENRALLRHVLEKEALSCDYREAGHLHLALTEQQLAEQRRSRERLQQEGIEATVLDRTQVQQHIHTPLGPAILGGFLVPENGLLHSAKLIQGLGQAARRHGMQSMRATAQRITARGNQVWIETDGGSILADGAVVALNAWTGDLLPDLTRTIIPVRGQMLAYQALPPIFTHGVTASTR